MISAGVMIAKVIWNMTKTPSGRPLCACVPRPARNSLSSAPIQPWLSPKARLYPATIHRIETRQQIAKQCIRTESTFRAWTRPP